MREVLQSDEVRAILGMSAVVGSSEGTAYTDGSVGAVTVAGSAVATFTEPQGVWLLITLIGVSLAVVGGTYMVIVPADLDSK